MANACATLSEFLVQAPEFKTVGPVSSGIATLVANLVAGDTFTVAEDSGLTSLSVLDDNGNGADSDVDGGDVDRH